MHFTGTLQNFDDSLWGFHILIPLEIANIFVKEKKNKRVICSFRNKEQIIHCALMPDGLGGWFINMNKELRKKLKLNHLDEIAISIEEDNSKYGMPMPEEFQELLDYDPEGDVLFHQLTAGKQRSLIHFISKYKAVDTRINKALIIVDYLKQTQGELDWKELNEAFKRGNL